MNVVKKLSAKKQSQNTKGAILQFSIAMVCPDDDLPFFRKTQSESQKAKAAGRQFHTSDVEESDTAALLLLIRRRTEAPVI